jgi:hypothetical protein
MEFLISIQDRDEWSISDLRLGKQPWCTLNRRRVGPRSGLATGATKTPIPAGNRTLTVSSVA